jgi:hypothetical protein
VKFRAKLHLQDNEKLLAICDAHLIGKLIKHNGVNIPIQERFYGELEYSVDEILIEIKTASSVNIMGSDICTLLTQENLVHPDIILWLGEKNDLVGHAIVVK